MDFRTGIFASPEGMISRLDFWKEGENVHSIVIDVRDVFDFPKDREMNFSDFFSVVGVKKKGSSGNL